MLLRCNVEEWAGFPQRARESLLNTQRMSKVTSRPNNRSRVYYSYPDGHRRGDLHPLLIDATPAEINAASETPLFNDFCEFEVYRNDSIDADTYIVYIKARDILRITAYDDNHCFLYVHHNEVDISRYLVRYGIEAIYNILIGGSTTTGEDFSWSSYWATLISATVETAAPTHVVLTFPSEGTSVATDITATVNGVAVTVSSASWTGGVWTVILASAVVYGDVVIVTFVPSGGTAAVTNNVAAEAELTAYITGLTTPLTDIQKVRVNNFIKKLKTGLSVSALSEAFDVMYLFRNETAETYPINLVKDAHHATAVNAITFTAKTGVAGNGTTSYLNLHYNAFTEGSAYGLNSASYGFYCATDADIAGASPMGVRKAYQDDMSYIILKGGGSGTAFINQDAITDVVSTPASTIGMFCLSRTAADATNLYQNKTVLNTSADASNAIPDYDWFGLAHNRAGTPAGFDSRTYEFMFIGKGLSADEVGIITDAYNEYRWSIANEDNRFDNGKLILTFDDAPSNWVSNILPLMTAKSFGFTGFIVGDWVGDAGRCTWAQLQQLQAAGADLEDHSFDHTDLTTLNEAQVLEQLSSNKALMEANGLTNINHLAYPGGAYSDNVKTWTATVRQTGRRAGGGEIFSGVFYNNIDKYLLPAKVLGDETIADIGVYENLIDIVSRTKSALMLYGHNIVATDVEVINNNYATAELLGAIVDYARSKNVDIITVSQLYSLLA